MKVSVTWCFEDTDFENLQYEEARINAGLPKNVVLEDFEEEEDEVESFLFENFGFEVSQWECID